MCLGDRIKETLKAANLTPRHLGGATRVHFVSIYSLMRDGTIVPNPLTKHALTTALTRIDELVKEGKLPLTGRLTRKEKTEQLMALLSDH